MSIDEAALASGPPGGWADFCSSAWERDPVHYVGTVKQPICTATEAFSIMVRACKRHKDIAHLRFMVDNGLIQDDLSPILPREDDGDFAAYVARLDRKFGERDFSLVLNRAQMFDFELWRRSRSFLRGLFDRVGYPLYADLVIWLSRARVSSFGIHYDQYSNFLFPLIGNKRFRLWRPEYIERHPEFVAATDYDAIARDGSPYDMAAGDLFYMPPGIYHVGETSRQVSLHFSIIVTTDPAEPNRLIETEFTRLLQECIEPPMRVTRFRGAFPGNTGEFELPAEISQWMAVMTDARETFETRIAMAWARRLTGFGCNEGPPLATVAALRDDDVLEADRDNPVVWQVRGTTMLCACNGWVEELPAHPNVVRFVRELGAANGRRFRVGEVVGELQGSARVGDVEFGADGDEIRSVLEMLCSLRALRRVTPEP